MSMSLSTSVSSTLSSSSSSSSSCLDEDLAALMKSSLPSKFSALVTMHLSFMLDLSGTGLSDLIDEQQQQQQQAVDRSTVTHDRSKIFSSMMLFGKKKHTKDLHTSSVVFGQPLTQRSIDRIQPVIEFLGQPDNLKQEGLFRKAGHVDRQRLLCDRLNADTDQPDLEDFTVHDCANVLKTFLGELPEPLLTEKYLTAYRQVVEMQSDVKRVQTLQLLIQLLPTEHATLLRSLLDLLHRVTLEPGNRMTADNLAILFVPHIIVPRKTPLNELQQTSANFTGLMSLMITCFDELFLWPQPLVRDIALYYHRTVHDACAGSLLADDEETSSSSSKSSTIHHKKEDSDEDGIVTTVEFADRQASQLAAIQFDTAKAIADLYAHVSQMPDSAHKRRLMKQFNKSMGTPTSATPNKRKMAISFTQSIKRMMQKRHRSGAVIDENAPAICDRASSEDVLAESETPARMANNLLCESPESESVTPVKKLFDDDRASLRNCCLQEIETTVKPVGAIVGDCEHSCRDGRTSCPGCCRALVASDRHSSTVSTVLSETSDACALPSSCRRPCDVIVDVSCPGDHHTDYDSCESDKENATSRRPGSDAVFMFHHTQSVIAMERIFAQQRLPNYVKPNGYISPLRCPRYLVTPAHSASVTVTATP